MAQTGFTPISTYYTTTASAVPTAGNLVNGELALNINTADGKLFYKDSAGVVQVLATRASTSGSFTNLAYTGTLTGGTGIVNLGSGQFYKDASGFVGLGTASPDARLTIETLTDATAVRIKATNSTVSLLTFGIGLLAGGTPAVRGSGNGLNVGTGDVSPLQLFTNATERMRIEAGGNVKIGNGAAAASAKLMVNTPSGTAANLQLFQDGNESWIIANPASSTALTFANSGAERMRIEANGNLLVGTTGAGARFRVDSAGNTNATNAVVFNNSSVVEMFRLRNDGALFTGSSTSGLAACPYNNTTASAANMVVGTGGDLQRSTSSLKYKTDVENAVHGLAEVLKLRSVTYKGKNDGDIVFGGLIAEEVDKVGLTEFVTYADDGSPDALAYGQMVSLAFKAIQEQQALIENLTTRLTALENK
jgi:hypothetical protein